MTGNEVFTRDKTMRLLGYHSPQSSRQFRRTWLEGFRHRRRYRDVTAYVMFVGYPRSGHTLVAAHMTAHPEMVISNELHALNFIAHGYRRNQLFEMIRRKDNHFVSKKDCQDGAYKYSVPGQWQGQYRKLKVIGDKKGAGSSQLLRRNPQLVDLIQQRVGVPVRIIHVVRNPFDNIARIHLRTPHSLDKAIRRYFAMCGSAANVVQSSACQVLSLRHEDYVSDPGKSLATVCRFAGVEPGPEYLEACAKMVRESPRLARHECEWSPSQIREVEGRIEEFEFLRGYEFHVRRPIQAAA